MTTCQQCGNEYETEELVRHERGDLLLVHCPGCDCLLGQYRDPSKRSRVRDL